MVTRSKNLRTGRSLWESEPASRVAHRRLTANIDVDVLIIGAGITGAMVADGLSGHDVSVALVDKRGPAKGSTTASTALVQHEIDTPLTKLAHKIGKPNAVRAWRRSRLAVDAISARLSEIGYRDAEHRRSLYLAGNLLDADELHAENLARRAAGLATCFLDRKALRERFGIKRAAALLSYDTLLINPRQAAMQLLKATQARGARVFSPEEIVSIRPSRRGVVAVSGSGHEIRCGHLVFATGYELIKGVPHRGHHINSTWAIATPPQPRRLWPERCTIWEAAEPYLYLRPTPDGRIICGGEDEDFSDEEKRDALLERKTKALQRKLARLVPGVDTTAAFAWTGSFGSSNTGLPRIGEVPDMQNCWVALGYGGNGTTYARIAADVICGAIAGRPDVDADLYDF